VPATHDRMGPCTTLDGYAALRPRKEPWEDNRCEAALPLVSPIARRTFLD
jgi:hypothetical protein